MGYACERCDHLTFETREERKNHSRLHAPTCRVQFPPCASGRKEEDTLHRDKATQAFHCPRCLGYRSTLPGKMQAHCRACEAGPNLGPSPTAPPSVPRNDDRGSYLASELGYFVNVDLHVAICRACQIWVEVGSLSRHAARFHMRNVDARLLSADVTRFELDRGAASLEPYRRITAELKEPVAGLPVVDGVGCALCVFYTPNLQTLNAHLRNAHRLERTAGSNPRAFSVQRLSTSPRNNSWYAVAPPARDPAPGDARGRLLEIVARDVAERRADVVPASYGDARHVPLYMKMLHFDEFVEKMGGDVAALAPLVAARAGGDESLFPDRLAEVCAALMEDFQRSVGDADVLLRRKVKSSRACEVSANPFLRLDRSSADYVATLVHLILVLLRSLRRRDADVGRDALLDALVPLDGGVRRSLRDLHGGLQTGDWVADGGLETCKAHGVRLLRALFYRERKSHLVPETSFLVYRFVLFAALQHRRVLKPDDVTHRCSRLMYWCRSLVLYQIVRSPRRPPPSPTNVRDGEGEGEGDGGDSDDDSGLRADGADTDDGGGVESRLLAFVRGDRRTPFAALLEAKRLVSAVTRNDHALPKVVWVGDAQAVGSVAVEVGDVSRLIRRSVGELYRELERDVLLGMPAYGRNKVRVLRTKSGRGMEDDLHDGRVGHSFVSNANNHCSDYAADLFRHIVGDVALRARFVERVDAAGGGLGSIVWNRDALARWMRTAARWLQKLLSVAHLLSGQPARGVEFLSCAIRNTPAQIRGVYYVQDLIMFLCLYGKVDNARGIQRPIARFLCKDTTFLLVNYLAYVRETEIVASGILYGPDRTLLYGRMLAVKEGRPMTSTDLTEGISALFLEHVLVPMSLSAWRHMAIAWLHRFLRYTSIAELMGDGAADSQAGHSRGLASRCYARSNFDHPNLGREELQVYRLLSAEWHRILGLPSDAPPSDSTAVVPTGSPATPASAPGPAVSHHHHHEVRVIHSPGDVGIGLPSVACSEAALKGLALLGHTHFKSSHQAEAVHRILAREEDLLAVLPTAGGKTLLFLLPAAVESGHLTTVVVCPFVALKREMERRLRGAGVSMAVYSRESQAAGPVDILLVSVENCLSPDFQARLLRLHEARRLARIVVDECHLATTAGEWRPAMRNLARVRQVSVPLVLLSGTVPPSMEGELREFFDCRLAVVRSSTNRPNISYEVRRSKKGSLRRLFEVVPTPKSILFCRGRDHTKNLANRLRGRGLSAVHYHGQLDAADKDSAYRAWTSGDADIMVATGAFGTGVDLGGVRLVVHLDEPYSMIDLAQESGRGGRDGGPCRHVVLLKKSWKPREGTCRHLAEYLGGSKCRRRALLQYVDGHGLDCFSSGSARCDFCESAATRILAVVPGVRRPRAEAEADGGDDEDPLPCTAGGASDAWADRGSPSKRPRVEDALFSGSAKRTQRQLASQSLVFLELARYLRENRDECILCVVRDRPAGEPRHDLPRCPYVRNLCFKCLGSHAYSACPNRLPWDVDLHCLCFGCGLPAALGQQVLHPEKFGTNCRSIGNDKLVPLCWYLWRNREGHPEAWAGCACPDDLGDLDFARWLTGSHPTFRTNVIHLFVSYIRSGRNGPEVPAAAMAAADCSNDPGSVESGP